MDADDLKNIVKEIIIKSTILKDKYTNQKSALVSYVAIFCQNNQELKEFTKIVKTFSTIINETPTGIHYRIPPLDTISGKLEILKIRIPDKTRHERGDADYNVDNFEDFKKKYLPLNEFKLIKRPNHEMIELMESGADVRVYFSNPHIDKLLGIK